MTTKVAAKTDSVKEAPKTPKSFDQITTLEKIHYLLKTGLSFGLLKFKAEGWSPEGIESLNKRDLEHKKIWGISHLTLIRAGLFLGLAALIAGVILAAPLIGLGVLMLISLCTSLFMLTYLVYKAILIFRTPSGVENCCVKDAGKIAADLVRKHQTHDPVAAQRAVYENERAKTRQA